MAGTFKFELVSPERVLLSIDADHVVVPGSDGEFGVLAGHAPVIATLRPGVLDVTAGRSNGNLSSNRGSRKSIRCRLTVLAEKAYDVDEMSSSAIADELKAAEADLAAAKDDNAKRMADTLVSELKRLSARAA